MASRPMCRPGCEDPTHYGCVLRAKGMQISPAAMRSRTQNLRPSRKEPPAYNRTIIYDERPDGTKVPFLNPDGSVVRQLQYDRERKQIDAKLRRLRGGT